MYRAKYIGYVDDVEILFWARLARKLDRAVVKLGGEGRLAAVEGKEAGAPPAGSQRGEYAVALQPILIYSDKPVARLEEVLGLECVEEVYGVFEGDGSGWWTSALGSARSADAGGLCSRRFPKAPSCGSRTRAET